MAPINYTAFIEAKKEFRNYAILVSVGIVSIYIATLVLAYFVNARYIHSDLFTVLIFLIGGFGGLLLTAQIIDLLISKRRYTLFQKSRKDFAEHNGFEYSLNVANDLREGLWHTKNLTLFPPINSLTVKDSLAQFAFLDITVEPEGVLPKLPSIRETALVFYLNKAIPNIYIANKKYSSHPGLSFLGQSNELVKLHVDLEYEKDHVVSAVKGEEIEALQLLDSNFTNSLSKYVPVFDIEFFGTYMVIYLPPILDISKLSSTNEQNKFEESLAIARSLSPILGKQLENFSYTPQGDTIKELEYAPTKRIGYYGLFLMLLSVCLFTLMIYMLEKLGFY